MPTPEEVDEQIAGLPPFTDDPIDRLRHSLAAFETLPDDRWAIHATYNAVPDHRDTGVTWGDLRQTLAIVDELRNNP